MEVFTELARHPEDLATLQGRLGLHPRSARDSLDTLVALGFLGRADGKYHNTPDTDLFLDKRKPSYIGGIRLVRCLRSPRRNQRPWSIIPIRQNEYRGSTGESGRHAAVWGRLMRRCSDRRDCRTPDSHHNFMISGAVWRGLARFGAIWRGWRDLARFGAVLRGLARFGAVWRGSFVSGHLRHVP